MNYPRFEDLGIDPIEYSLSAAIIDALNGTVPPSTRVMPEKPDKETTRLQVKRHRRAQGVKPRVYKSRYVGVTQHRGRWLAQWGSHGATKGRVFELTPEGELQAAWERTRALGLSEPEVRDSTCVIAPQNAAHALEPRGPMKTRLGGKRIA